MDSGAVKNVFEKKPGFSNVPFVDQMQRFVLYSVSHAQSPPIATDPKNPAIRLYGAFQNEKTAIAHAQKVMSSDPTTSIMLCETHRWNLATFSTELAKDATYVKTKTDLLLKRSQVEASVSKARFEQHCEELRKATTVSEQEEKPLSTTTPTDDDDFELVNKDIETNNNNGNENEGNQNVPPPLSADCKLANQDCFCISFIKEPQEEDNPEFLFYVYWFSKNEDEMDGYIRNVACRRVKEHDILVAEACEWIHPYSDTSKINKIYRDDRLNDFMKRNSTDANEEMREMMDSC